jgi:RNA polymerase sigma-70 factor, ECF subfamily
VPPADVPNGHNHRGQGRLGASPLESESPSAGPERHLDATAGTLPEQFAEASDLAAATWDAIEQVLSPHQRSVTIALLVDEVPIDVLAERLGTTRNALYKTLHVARGRLRAYLEDAGYLDGPRGERGAR